MLSQYSFSGNFFLNKFFIFLFSIFAPQLCSNYKSLCKNSSSHFGPTLPRGLWCKQTWSILPDDAIQKLQLFWPNKCWEDFKKHFSILQCKNNDPLHSLWSDLTPGAYELNKILWSSLDISAQVTASLANCLVFFKEYFF